MMLEFWNKISYMVELLVACMIFIIPIKMNITAICRSFLMAVLFITLAYIVNLNWNSSSSGFFYVMYWSAYYMVAGIFVWICMGGGFLRAAYVAIFACAVQHIAYDIYLIYSILVGIHYMVIVAIYIIVYGIAYFLFARKMADGNGITVSKKSLFPIMTIFVLVWVLSLMDDSYIVGFESGAMHRVIYRIIDALCCSYVLWVQISRLY